MSYVLRRRDVLLGVSAMAAGCATPPGSEPPFVWEHKMISSNGNFPDFPTDTPANTSILAALHERRAPPSDPESLAAMATLREKGFVTAVGGRLLPAVTVAGLQDGPRWFAVSDTAVAATVALISGRRDDVRRRVAALSSFAALDFDEVSLLILSDVLLDNWQIGNVERDWLGVERPQRAGGRYYYAMFARAEGSGDEAFGIYGNQFVPMGDVFVAVYGARRLTAPTLQTISLADINTRFGVQFASADDGRTALAQRLVAVARGESSFTAEERSGFAWLGLVGASGALRIPVMTEADYNALDAVAAEMTPPLVAVLNAERAALRRRFDTSPYAETISFEEYLIWWFHFFYSAVTDRLVRAGLVRLPPAGVATYLVAG